MAAIRSRSPASNRAPVGLFGLHTTISFVRDETIRSSVVRSSCHRPGFPVLTSGDGGAERQRAVRLRIAERFRQQRVAIETVVDELAQLQRSHAALRQVDVHLVLVDRLHPLQRELFDLHESRLYILVVSETSLGAEG